LQPATELTGRTPTVIVPAHLLCPPPPPNTSPLHTPPPQSQALLGAGLGLGLEQRTEEAARGCLLQLGALGDAAAEAALQGLEEGRQRNQQAAEQGQGAAGGGRRQVRRGLGEEGSVGPHGS
jgi:hypothetical protein